jgi:glutaredoxin 3
MTKVELYGAEWCGYSFRARQLLDKKMVHYRLIDVDTTPGARDEMVERGGGRTIPQIFIDDEPIGGCDDIHALEATGRLDTMLSS